MIDVSGPVAVAITRTRQIPANLLRWFRTREGTAFLWLLVAALLLRLILAPKLMLTGDLVAYAAWGQLALTHFFDAYSTGAANPNWIYWPGYPPLALYVFGALDGVFLGITHLIGLNPPLDPNASHGLRVVLKIPAICSDLGIMCFVYALARRVISQRAALIAAATYAFTPGILIVTLLWGQTDGFVVLLAALGLYFAYRRQAIWAGVFLALAVGFKPQPAIFIPLGLVYLYRWGGWREALRGLGSLAGVSLALWLPYLLPPRFEVLSYLQVTKNIVQVEGPNASHGGYNLWYLLHVEANNVSDHLVGPLSIQMVSILLFGVVMLIVLAGVWRDDSARVLWIGAGLLALGFFDLGTLQFERYLAPAVALFLLAAIYDRRYWVCYAGVSVMLYLNFAATVVGCGCYPPVAGLPPFIQELLDLNLRMHIKTGSAINLALLVIGIYWYLFPHSLFPGLMLDGNGRARQTTDTDADMVAAPGSGGLGDIVVRLRRRVLLLTRGF